jgi:hypothetical protein
LPKLQEHTAEFHHIAGDQLHPPRNALGRILGSRKDW